MFNRKDSLKIANKSILRNWIMLFYPLFSIPANSPLYSAILIAGKDAIRGRTSKTVNINNPFFWWLNQIF